eukprot:gene25143-30363_t
MTHSFVAFPEAVLQIIFESWLKMKDLASLDIALSCRLERSKYLNFLQNAFVDAQSPLVDVEDVDRAPKWCKDATLLRYLNWIVARKCKLRQPLSIGVSLTSYTFLSKVFKGSMDYSVDGVKVGSYGNIVGTLYFSVGLSVLYNFLCTKRTIEEVKNLQLQRLKLVTSIFPKLKIIVLLNIGSIYHISEICVILEVVASSFPKTTQVIFPEHYFSGWKAATSKEVSLFIDYTHCCKSYGSLEDFESFFSPAIVDGTSSLLSQLKSLQIHSFSRTEECKPLLLFHCLSLQSLECINCPLTVVGQLLANLPNLKEFIHSSFYCNFSISQPVLAIDDINKERREELRSIVCNILPPIHTLKLHKSLFLDFSGTLSSCTPLLDVLGTQLRHVRRLELDRIMWCLCPGIVSCAFVCLEEFVSKDVSKSDYISSQINSNHMDIALSSLISCSSTLRLVDLEAYGSALMEKDVIALVRALPVLTSFACKLSRYNSGSLLAALQGRVWEYLGLGFLPLADIVDAAQRIPLAFKKIKFRDTSVVEGSDEATLCLGHGRVPIPLEKLQAELALLEKVEQENRILLGVKAQEDAEESLREDILVRRTQSLQRRRIAYF